MTTTMLPWMVDAGVIDVDREVVHDAATGERVTGATLDAWNDDQDQRADLATIDRAFGAAPDIEVPVRTPGEREAWRESLALAGDDADLAKAQAVLQEMRSRRAW